MGMSSSQARLLNLTGRMHQIEYKAAKLEAQKLQMANESRRVYNEYQQALEKTKVQFLTMTNNGGIDYADATLAGLENAIVHDTEILTSAKSFLLHNVNTNEIYLTSKVADALNIENEETLTDKETYLNNHGVQKIPEVITKKVVKPGTTIEYVQNVGPQNSTEINAYSYSIEPGAIANPYEAPPQPATYIYTTTDVKPSITKTDYELKEGATLMNEVTPLTESEAISRGYTCIHNASEFLNISSGKYILMDNINLSDETWSTISSFSGELNGNGYKISGVDKTIFGTISGGNYNEPPTIIKNLGINTDNMPINWTGIVAKSLYAYVNMENIAITGSTTSGAATCAIIASSMNGVLTISDSYADIQYDSHYIVYGLYDSASGYANCNNYYFKVTDEYNNSSEYTYINSNSSANGNYYPNRLPNQTFTTKSIIKGELSVPTDTDMKNYLAYMMYTYDSNKKELSTYLAKLSSYDSFQLAGLYYNATPSVITSLNNGTDVSYYINLFTSEYYNLSPSNSNQFNIIDNSILEYKSVTVSSKSNIKKALAVGAQNADSVKDKEISYYDNIIENLNLSDKELASISKYANTDKWSSICNKILQNGTKNAIENIQGVTLTTYDDYDNVTFNTESDIEVSENHQYQQYYEIPTNNGIASNFVAAFRDLGNIISDEKASGLASYFGMYSDKELATLNNLITIGGADLNEIYTCFENNEKVDIDTSFFDDYYISPDRISGTCTVEYDEQSEETENMIWDENDPNYIYWSNMYEVALKMQENKATYRVIDDTQANSKDYLNTLLANDSFVFIDFEKGLEGDNYTHTSVATDTRLREVADESGLRKAEAKYEADMRRIDMKDRKYDYDLAALDNERNAIKNEMETLKTVAKDNVDRTFKLFG